MAKEIKLREGLHVVRVLQDSITYLNELAVLKGVNKTFYIEMERAIHTLNIKEELKHASDPVLESLQKKGFETTGIEVLNLKIKCKCKAHGIYDVGTYQYRIYNKKDLMNFDKQQINVVMSLLRDSVATYIGMMDTDIENKRTQKVNSALKNTDGTAIKKTIDTIDEAESLKRDDHYNWISNGGKVISNVDDTLLKHKVGDIIKPIGYDIKKDAYGFKVGDTTIWSTSTNYNHAVE